MNIARICKIKKSILFATILIMLMGTLCLTASAETWSYTDQNGTEVAMTEWEKDVESVYNTFSNVSIACGTISFIFGAMQMLWGDEKSVSRGKMQIRYTLLAVVAIQLLPVVVGVGVEIGQRYGWNPFSPQE